MKRLKWNPEVLGKKGHMFLTFVVFLTIVTMFIYFANVVRSERLRNDERDSVSQMNITSRQLEAQEILERLESLSSSIIENTEQLQRTQDLILAEGLATRDFVEEQAVLQERRFSSLLTKTNEAIRAIKTGPPGPTGPQGSQGPAGPAGERGKTGSPGTLGGAVDSITGEE